MRTVLWIFISFVLAALVMLGGCLALAALQGDAVPRAGRRPDLALPGDPTSPAPLSPALPRSGNVVEATAEKLAQPLRRATGSLDVELRDRIEPAPDPCGVGVLDGESHTLLAWQALPAPAATQRLRFDGLPAGTHVIVLAERERGRYAYSTRTVATIEADRTTAVTLDAHRQAITLDVTLPAQLQPLAAPSLVRSDDPRWHAEPIEVPRSVANRLSITLPLLGAGDYRLSLDGLAFENSDDGTLALQVPGPAQITTAAVPR